MWFTENPLKIDIKINIPIEIFEIILFIYYPEKLFCTTKKIMFPDDYVIIFLLTTITTTAKNTHTHSNQT